jgi:integrase
MPATNLTENFVKAKNTRADYFDEKAPGLILRINIDGTQKAWLVRYTDPATKKRVLKSIGYWLPDQKGMSIAEARQQAIAIKLQTNVGVSPERPAKEEVTVETAPLLLGEAVEMFLPTYLAALKNENSRNHARWFYDAKIVPALGAKKPLAEITRAMLNDLIQRTKTDAPVAANRLRNKLNVFFNWAADPDGVALIETNPMSSIKKPHKEVHKAALKRKLTDTELPYLLRAIQRTKHMTPAMKSVLRLIALTSRRPNEVCNLKFSYINDWDDPEQTTIVFPGSIMKAGLEYILPVTPEVRTLLEDVVNHHVKQKSLGRGESEWLFPTKFNEKLGDRPVSPNSVAQAMSRMIPRLVADGRDAPTLASILADLPSPYAFRRTVPNGMSRLGVRRENTKAVMAHGEDDVLAAHYDAYERLDEKREALTLWGAEVTRLMTTEQRTGILRLVPASKKPATATSLADLQAKPKLPVLDSQRGSR